LTLSLKRSTPIKINTPPTLSQSISSTTAKAGDPSTLTYTINNTAGSLDIANIGLTNNLPTGVVVASPNNASTSCSGGLITAAAGSSTFSYSAGSLKAGQNCTLRMNVTTTKAGSFTIFPEALSSSSGSAVATSVTLTSTITAPLLSKNYSPSVVGAGGTSTLTYTYNNTANKVNVQFLGFDDTLQTGVIFASPNNLNSACVAGTAIFPANNQITFTGGEVAAKSTCTISMTVLAQGRVDLNAGITLPEPITLTNDPATANILSAELIDLINATKAITSLASNIKFTLNALNRNYIDLSINGWFRGVFSFVSNLPNSANLTAGIHLTVDGYIQIVTSSGRVILMRAESHAGGLLSELVKKFNFSIQRDNFGNLRFIQGSTKAQVSSSPWISIRPGILSEPISDGLINTFIPVAHPEVPGYIAFVHTYQYEEKGYQQPIHAVPADWESFKNYLYSLGIISLVRMDSQGIISFVIEGIEFRGIMDYGVIPGSENGQISATVPGDLNADGTVDLKIIYSNGDQQFFYLIK